MELTKLTQILMETLLSVCADLLSALFFWNELGVLNGGLLYRTRKKDTTEGVNQSKYEPKNHNIIVTIMLN
jgi:hypothetical protein